MFKLLTKFKTQSLNEVKPYESNGSFVSASRGEIQNSDDGTQHHQEAVYRSEHENMDSAAKDLIRTPFHTRMPNVHLRTLHFPNEPFKGDESMTKNENKENGEKLADLNSPATHRPLSAEKRKWSDVKRSRFPKPNSSSDSSSSDEEVKELLSKQQKSSTSNTNGSEDRRQKTSPAKIRPSDSHARKRHRTISHERIYTRPSLDFEKMQQKVFWKRSTYGTSRPRIVKVRSFVGHPAHNLLPDSSVMTFQPIQGICAIKLPPVEETRTFAY